MLKLFKRKPNDLAPDILISATASNTIRIDPKSQDRVTELGSFTFTIFKVKPTLDMLRLTRDEATKVHNELGILLYGETTKTKKAK